MAYHVHTDHSLLDSCTKYKDYIDRAAELGQKAIAFSEHGVLYCWPMKKEYCENKGLKYLHAVEIYLTATHEEKVRDNYHTVLIAKNYKGVQEINSLVSLSFDEDHFYYKPRISFDEFLNISSNIISTSACLASPLNNIEESDPYFEKLVKKYTYLEVQPHDNADQMFYNERLVFLSKKYDKPLIAGTDTHSLNTYKSECRKILKLEKKIDYASEDDFDLTYKSYDELVDMFKSQGVLTEEQYLEAIDNTNVLADMIEDFEIDKSFKYPILYGTAEKDEEKFVDLIWKKFDEKIDSGIIPWHQEDAFRNAIKEECRVFSKLGMSGFMLFMSEMLTWCREHGIPTGFGRGSVCGSRVAYVIDIIDVNPEEWHTVFSRFCNENRVEAGDIDVDFAPDDRDKVYEYIINRFGQDKTGYVLALGTISEKGTIDSIGRALSYLWDKENLVDVAELRKRLKQAREDDDSDTVAELTGLIKKTVEQNDKKRIKESPYSLSRMADIKKAYDANPDETRKKYPKIFYYFDGLKDTCISQSMHPAGIVASSWTLPDNYGMFVSKKKTILQLDMDSAHECGLIKYDILGLVNVQIIRDGYKLLGKSYPLSHEIDWFDEKVWEDMMRSPVGIFQFEAAHSFSSLKKFEPKSLFDMSLVTAAIRPSGASYRDRLLSRDVNKNPSEIIDELLKNNNGFLVYQEDIIAFLQQVCGLTGSEADNIRRCIAQKREEKLQEAMPSILEGYCSKSSKPRDEAEKEAKVFLKIIEDASAYMFGYNHSLAYCMIGYLCAYLRYYHPYEFITAFLNNANNEDDIRNGSELARLYKINIVSPKFGVSRADYMYDKDKGVIAKGVSSIKFLNTAVSNQLFAIARNKNDVNITYDRFVDLLVRLNGETNLNSRQLDILIKLDYFSYYGNIAELIEINKMFNSLKCGLAKQISKDGLSDKEIEIMKVRCTDRKKDGSESKKYTVLDMKGLLCDLEDLIRSKNIQDVSIIEKIEVQQEYLGYIDIATNNIEDKYKLLITDVLPLKGKFGEPWAYKLTTKSICTGRISTVNVNAEIYNKKPIKKMNIINVQNIKKNAAGYFYVWKYEIL